MFVVTSGDENSSQDALELVHSIERELFDQLGRFNLVFDQLGRFDLVFDQLGRFKLVFDQLGRFKLVFDQLGRFNLVFDQLGRFNLVFTVLFTVSPTHEQPTLHFCKKKLLISIWFRSIITRD